MPEQLNKIETERAHLLGEVLMRDLQYMPTGEWLSMRVLVKREKNGGMFLTDLAVERTPESLAKNVKG